MLGNFLVAAQLATSQEGLSSVSDVILLIKMGGRIHRKWTDTNVYTDRQQVISYISFHFAFSKRGKYVKEAHCAGFPISVVTLTVLVAVSEHHNVESKVRPLYELGYVIARAGNCTEQKSCRIYGFPTGL
jgi:hypothetical protein